MSIPHRNYLTD